MKNKKLISSLLSVGLMVGITTPAFAYTDVPDTNPYVAYANENYLLPELDKNGKFEPLKKVTFLEFADIFSMYKNNVIDMESTRIGKDGSIYNQPFNSTTGKFTSYHKSNTPTIRYQNLLNSFTGPDYNGTEGPKVKVKYPTHKIVTWNDFLNFIEIIDTNPRVVRVSYQRGTSIPEINQFLDIQPLPKATKTYTNFNKLSKWQQKLVTKHNDFLQIVLPHKELNLKKPMTRIELVKALKILGPGLHGDELARQFKSNNGSMARIKYLNDYPVTEAEKQEALKPIFLTMEEAQRLYH